MAEIGIGDRMRWTPTSMGYSLDGKLHKWGDPVALLAFPGLGLIDKLRYGLLAFTSTKRSDWRRLDDQGRSMDRDVVGKRGYDKLWRPLFALKFFRICEQYIRRLDLDAA